MPSAAGSAPYSPLHEPEELGLRDYARILSRRKVIVIASTLLMALLGVLFYIRQTPRYVATAELTFASSAVQVALDGAGFEGGSGSRTAQTEIRIIRSDSIQERVAATVGSPVPPPRASVVEGTEIIQVSVTDDDPEQAALASNTYATEYLAFRAAQDEEDLLAGRQELEQRIAAVDAQIAAIDGAAVAAGVTSQEALVQLSQLGTRRTQLEEQLSRFQAASRLRERQAQVITPADPPPASSDLSLPQALVFGAALGLALGMGVAFVRHWFDDSIVDRRDLENAGVGLPVLGAIPQAARSRAVADGVASLNDSEGAAAEAYRGLRTSVQALAMEEKLRSIQVAAPAGGEGTTATAANLAVLFAQAGTSVVLVDGDLRQPRVHDCFGLPNANGFASVLSGAVAVADALQDVTSVPGLTVLTSGPVPPRPSELLSSGKTKDLIDALEADFDLVIVDGPPVLAATDASVLTLWVDGVVLVARAKSSSRHDLQRAIETLGQVDARVLGTVLNGAPTDTLLGRYGAA